MNECKHTETIREHGELLAVIRQRLDDGKEQFVEVHEEIKEINRNMMVLSEATASFANDLKRHMDIEEAQRDAQMQESERRHKEVEGILERLTTMCERHEKSAANAEKIGWDEIAENHKMLSGVRSTIGAGVKKGFIVLISGLVIWALVLLAQNAGLNVGDMKK